MLTVGSSDEIQLPVFQVCLRQQTHYYERKANIGPKAGPLPPCYDLYRNGSASYPLYLEQESVVSSC